MTMDREDLELLADIVDLYDAMDPMPEMLPDVVLLALGATDLDADMARLVEVESALVGTRGAPVEHARRITFSTDHLTVMVAVEPLGTDAVRLDGWAAPGHGLRVDLRCGTDEADVLTTECDDTGRFVFESVPTGPAQLILHPTEHSDPEVRVSVVTPALRL